MLWLLSPLGGQSSLRILGFSNRLIISQGQIHYFSLSPAPDTYSVFESEEDYSSFIVSALLDASLMQSDNVLNSPVDQWNNVKIPRLDNLSPFTEAALGNPWISVNQTTQKAWSPLTGLMILQLPVADTSNFTLESSYLNLSCTNSTPIEQELFQRAFESRLRFHNASSPSLRTELVMRTLLAVSLWIQIYTPL